MNGYEEKHMDDWELVEPDWAMGLMDLGIGGLPGLKNGYGVADTNYLGADIPIPPPSPKSSPCPPSENSNSHLVPDQFRSVPPDQSCKPDLIMEPVEPAPKPADLGPILIEFISKKEDIDYEDENQDMRSVMTALAVLLCMSVLMSILIPVVDVVFLCGLRSGGANLVKKDSGFTSVVNDLDNFKLSIIEYKGELAVPIKITTLSERRRERQKEVISKPAKHPFVAKLIVKLKELEKRLVLLMRRMKAWLR